MATSKEELAAIEQVYNSWQQAWLRFPDIKPMLSVFAQDFDGMIYQAEENPNALRSYKEIETYWQNAYKLLEKVTEWREVTKSVAVPAPNVAFVWAEVMTALKTTVLAEQLCGKIRCSIGMRRGDSGWKIVHYHESRQLLAETDKAGKWQFKVDLTIR